MIELGIMFAVSIALMVWVGFLVQPRRDLRAAFEEIADAVAPEHQVRVIACAYCGANTPDDDAAPRCFSCGAPRR